MNDVNRRDFLVTTAAVACGCAMACSLVDAADAPAAAPAGPFDAGAVADYAAEKVYDKFAPKPNKFFLVNDAGKLYAPTSTCSHKNCVLKIVSNEIKCPCHGSKFTSEGTPTKGPAKYSLYRFSISVNDKGHVIVDKTKQFEEKDWGKEGSFVAVKK